MADNNCSRPVTQTWYSVTYGTPNPRFIRPLVRINGMTEDMPFGYKFDPYLMPPTILRINNCNQTLQVNDAMISYKDMFPCLKLPVGSDDPVNAPSEGYYPFYLKLLTPTTANLFAHTGTAWVKIVP